MKMLGKTVVTCSECESLLVTDSYWLDESETDGTLHIKVEPCIICSNKFNDDTENTYDDMDDAIPDDIKEYGSLEDIYGD